LTTNKNGLTEQPRKEKERGPPQLTIPSHHLHLTWPPSHCHFSLVTTIRSWSCQEFLSIFTNPQPSFSILSVTSSSSSIINDHNSQDFLEYIPPLAKTQLIRSLMVVQVKNWKLDKSDLLSWFFGSAKLDRARKFCINKG